METGRHSVFNGAAFAESMLPQRVPFGYTGEFTGNGLMPNWFKNHFNAQAEVVPSNAVEKQGDLARRLLNTRVVVQCESKEGSGCFNGAILELPYYMLDLDWVAQANEVTEKDRPKWKWCNPFSWKSDKDREIIAKESVAQQKYSKFPQAEQRVEGAFLIVSDLSAFD